ncbi:uncharacterized protein [Trachinotus anak]|uniref:uncharacterized protein isoform X2 n=1 Tax=Trachinotus anak TaxID=443729 RepID=UPI0039F2609B
MQLLFISALLLSAVAARPDSWRPWQDEKFPPAGGPKLDAGSKHCDGEQSVTQVSEDGDGGSGGDWSEGDSGPPVWAPGFMPGVPRFGSFRHFGRRRGPLRGKWPNMRNPNAKGNIVFSPAFKVDNVIVENITAVALKEGENLFLMPKRGGRRPHNQMQYVKLIYNSSEPNNVSIEYGVVKPMNFGEHVGEDDPEESDW